MLEKDSICEFSNQGNINFIVIKNSKRTLTSEEYVEDAMKLCDKFDEYSNLNMNVIFINNIIENDDKESNDTEEDKKENCTIEEFKHKNHNINIVFLKNIIKIRGDSL
ncbi:hypothetical protein [Clostridium lundense]|uniref:hypothetical protein n=1 Tax=Clostridium lundense TaxID=319475 RepID=UPI00048589A6|nr:hypothetical protein [Clostridium lundense]